LLNFIGGDIMTTFADKVYAEGDKELTANPEQAAVADVASADGEAAAGANPTKAEYDAVVTLANETKAQLNAALAALRTAGIIAT
jgi:hypothetical protein